MREVDKATFYAAMGGKNVHPRIAPGARWPFRASWETPAREVLGETVDYVPEGEALQRTRYYLAY